MRNLTVLDFGQYIAGPAAAAMLADMGAQVVRIDPPDGPRWTSPAAEGFNRRKRCIRLDLKRDDDLATARRMVASADVLIENLRPGVMQRLGLGPETCAGLNPRLIYVSLPGFASHDRKRPHLRAWEAVIAAESGQFTDMGLNRVLMGINPSFTPLTLASAYGALFAATATAAALVGRQASGRGEHIEVPLASALMEGLVYNSMHVAGYPERYKSPREREIERRRAAGESFDLTYADLQAFLDPFYRSYECADGRPFYVVAASHIRHARSVLEVLGLLEEALDAGLPVLDDWYFDRADWPAGIDCALGLYPLSRHWADWLSARMIERFRQRSSLEWEEAFGQAGIPGVAHRTSREWLNSLHALASGLVEEVNDARHGRMRRAGPVAWLAGNARLAATDGGAPTPVSASAPASRGWLAGVKILDLTNVIAGPTIASTLARFGAEVIKLDPVKPTFDPWNTVIFGLQAGRGKRSLLADIRTRDGRAILDRLIGWADVVTINALERQLAPLGLDHARLKSINPGIILTQLDAFGGPLRGPLSDQPGYDDLVQAMTGIMARFGGGLDTPEEHAHLGTIDVLAGIAGAFATAAALYVRATTGEPSVARCSLAAAGQLIQAPFLYDHDGRGPFDEPSGRAARGYSALYRLYEARDGWLFLAAVEGDLAALEKTMDCPALGALDDAARIEALAERFATAAMAHWIERLSAADIGVGAVSSLAALRATCAGGTADDSYRFDRFEQHPCGRPVTIFSPCAVRPGRSPISAPATAEKYGASTRAVLADLGYDSETIGDLLRRGIVSESWSRRYLPE